MPKPIEIKIGDKYNRWTIIEDLGSRRTNKGIMVRFMLCRCECGTIKENRLNGLRENKNKSCGCWNIEQAKKRATKHGLSGTRLYGIWKGMRKRCNYEGDINYKHYGARGIKVCEEWNDYKKFHDWSIMNDYADDLTIERIDYNGDYTPENCKWIPRSQQNNNTRKQRKFIGTDPQGNEHIGYSKKDFAELHNLSDKCVVDCLRGRQHTHKNWTFRYCE